MMKKWLLFLFLSLAIRFLPAQIPPGYYSDADSLWGDTLKEVLKEIIDDHTVLTYSSLWIHYYSTDKKPDSTVWDMYSDQPGGTPAYSYTFGIDQCGNYSGEGDCYNREHSFPKSWFNDSSPMNTDIFHIYPTDGYVNGKRSNLPYGEVGSLTWLSTNGSKVGTSSSAGYSGTVFEPIDEYKGDLARTYFYMLTRYMLKIATWNSPMLQSDSLTGWAKSLLLNWSAQDTVSLKEISRNDSIFKIQGNRNPFIDHPEYIDYIWGGVIPYTGLSDSQPDKGSIHAVGKILYFNNIEERSILNLYDISGRQLLSTTIGGRGFLELPEAKGLIIAVCLGTRYIYRIKIPMVI